MNTKEKFKDFVRNHPELLKHVQNNKKTWQEFYEMYDLYGDDEKIWDSYIKTPENKSLDLLNFLKNIDFDSIQEGVNSFQRVLGLLQDMVTNKQATIKSPRPLYRHFDD